MRPFEWRTPGGERDSDTEAARENETRVIRNASFADAPAMAALDAICFSMPWSLADFETELAGNEMSLYLVCETRDPGAGLVGYAGLWAILGEGHITNVAVRPGFRRAGIGTALLTALTERAIRERAVRDFTLEVRASNETAIRLYERFGFVAEGRRKAYYADTGEDAVIMWRRFHL